MTAPAPCAAAPDTAFLDQLASSAPTPGGGGAAAYCGALAAALASMVGSLTVGKPRYAAVEGEVEASLERLAELRAQLIGLVAADAAAFQPVAAAYRMPKATPEEAAAKEAALQQALVGACEVPLRIMEACLAVLREARFLALNGTRLAITDSGAAASLAKAALEGASLNVLINIGSMADAHRAAAFRASMDGMLAEGSELADKVYAHVVEELS